MQESSWFLGGIDHRFVLVLGWIVLWVDGAEAGGGVLSMIDRRYVLGVEIRTNGKKKHILTN